MASLIESYLIEFKRELRLPIALKRRILAEVTDHLHEALSDEQAHGLDAEEAEQRVLQRFGCVKEVAESFLLDSVASETYVAGKVLLATEVVLIAFSFLRARTQPPGPWPHDILPVQLTFLFIALILNLLFAIGHTLFVQWQAPELYAATFSGLTGGHFSEYVLFNILGVIFVLLAGYISYSLINKESIGKSNDKI
jgi:hypothetical protein